MALAVAALIISAQAGTHAAWIPSTRITTETPTFATQGRGTPVFVSRDAAVCGRPI